MILDSTELPYGPTYPPLAFDEGIWEHELDLMAKAHMNLVRVGDIGTWDQVEVEEGEIILDKLQRFYSLANKFNISVLLSTGTASPPLWLAKKHPDVRIVSNRGEAYPMGASYHWACIHHPGYLNSCQNYIETLVRFATQQPNHFGWQISNEIGFPFNPTREAGDIDLYCYCDHSKKGFIKWVKEKYGELGEVSKAWSWSTTNFHYLDWDEVFPPESLPKAWSSVTRWIDWRLFSQQAFTDHVAWQHDLISNLDPDHPTSVNTFNFKGFDRFGTYTGLDQWKIAKKVGHVGYDLYPGSGNKLVSRYEHNSMFLDHGRSVSNSAGSVFWLHEIESGPIGGWLLGPEHNTGEKDILTMCFESLGHDGKLLSYMPWREWDFHSIHWGALVDLDSKPTPRYDAAALVGKYLKANSAFLCEARVPKGEVAILEFKPNAIYLRGVDQEDILFDAQRGAYRAFWEQGYRVDFITPEQLADEGIIDYKFICLPLMGLINHQTADGLQEYVKHGGILIGFSRCGTLDERGWYHRRLPVPELGMVFGLEKIEADTLASKTITFNGQDYSTWLNRDILYPNDGTEILGKFEDGKPAVTMAQFGKGFGIYIATQADSGELNTESKLLTDVIASSAREIGINPQIVANYPENSMRKIDHHILKTAHRSEIILISYLSETTRIDLRLGDSHRQVKNIACGIVDKKPIKFSKSTGELSMTLSMDPKEVKCIEIHWK